MKIQSIRVFQFDYTLPGIYKLSGGREFSTLDTTIVEMETDTGETGLGEACPFGVTYGSAHALGVRAGIEELAPRLIGMDPRDVERTNDLMDDVLPGLDYVKSALDMASWDILGKSTGLPLYQLLGGHNGKRLPLISSVSTGSPEEMLERVRGFRSKGYIAHSVKIGDNDPSADVERVKIIMADRKPGEMYLLDANRGWTLDQALRFANLVGPVDACIEAPCRTFRECREFRQRTGLPVSLDEHLTGPGVMVEALVQGGADVVNIKTTKVGGVTKARRIRDMCTEAGLAMSIQETGGSDIAFAALVHLAQSTRPALVSHVWDSRELAVESLASGGPAVHGGYVTASDGPGLGVSLDTSRVGKPVAVFS